MLGMVLLFLSGSDLILIMFVALMLFGGDKLPEIARGLGKGIRDFKDASEGVKREINNQINSFEEKKAEEAAEKPVVAELPETTDTANAAAEVSQLPENAAGIPPVPHTMPFTGNYNSVPPVHGAEVASAEEITRGSETGAAKTE